MRYELKNVSISSEAVVYEEPSKEGKTEEEISELQPVATDKYFCSITMGIKDTESLNDSVFYRSITSTSDNKQTGFEVDEQREKEVETYMKNINL